MGRALACSFCGKDAGQVGRLLAGPKVHICDACVGVCVKILGAVPATFSDGWGSMSDQQLLAALKPTAAAVDGTRAVLQAQVEELRKRGASWDAIGSALGISRQAAWERFT
jgi:biotin operon repressor